MTYYSWFAANLRGARLDLGPAAEDPPYRRRPGVGRTDGSWRFACWDTVGGSAIGTPGGFALTPPRLRAHPSGGRKGKKSVSKEHLYPLLVWWRALDLTVVRPAPAQTSVRAFSRRP